MTSRASATGGLTSARRVDFRFGPKALAKLRAAPVALASINSCNATLLSGQSVRY
jgi:hypothetical protein